MDNSNITISSDIFRKIFVQNSTIDCVSKDKDIENDLSKLCSNQVTLCFISNYIQKKINDLMIEQYRWLNTSQYTSQQQFNEHYNAQFYQESLYGSTYSTQQTNKNNNGRLGPPNVQFDLNSLIGQITIDRFAHSLTSNSSFSTIRANCFLYSGKFQYEVLLLTKGTIQLGYASTRQFGGAICNFAIEKGVNDSFNSYFYDGNISSDYGEKFEVFDVISCCIDLDCCTVSFYRNGHYLGVAFDKIQIGSGIVYFPTISLAFNEKIIYNFGSSRFKYPIDGYRALEVQNELDIIKSNMLIEWLFNLILLECQANEDENIYENVNQEEIYQNLSHQSTHHQTSSNHKYKSQKSSPIKSRLDLENPFFYLTSSLIMEELESLLTNEYIIETCLFKHLIVYHTKNEIHSFLDIIWSLFNETNLEQFFNSIVLIIVYGFQFSQFQDEEQVFSELNLNYSASTYSTLHRSTNQLTNEISLVSQKQYLYIFLLLIQHKRTRIYFIENILFKKNLFFQLLDTKLIFDDKLLQKHLFPNLTLHDLNSHFNQMKINLNEPESSNQSFNQSTCQHNQNCSIAGGGGKLDSNRKWRNLELENSLIELESLQNMIIDTLIFQDQNCRSIFIDKFSTFLTELERQFINNRSISTNTFSTPQSVLNSVNLSVFHRLCSLIRNQYEKILTSFPLEFFIDSKYCSNKTIRIGGLYNHLEKNHQKEISIYNFELSTTNPLLSQVFVLVDHLIKLYSIGVHKQLGKYNNTKELLIELNSSIQNLDKLRMKDRFNDHSNGYHHHSNNSLDHLNNCSITNHHFGCHSINQTTLRTSNSFTGSLNENLRRSSSINLSDNGYKETYADECRNNLCEDECRENYFNHTKTILENDYLAKGHQYALLNLVFTYDRRKDLIWLLKIILQTFNQASGCLFSYIPHYYLVTSLNLCTALRFYFVNENVLPFDLTKSTNKLNSETQDLEYKQILKQFCQFITGHFADERIVNNDHKELITQSLISLINSKQGLNILENISIENRINLIKKLTQPFENRSWVNSNWILLRFWKGSGYAFKRETFLKLTNCLSNENINFFTKNDLISSSSDINPSLTFQQLLCDYFISNQKQAFIFLTSLLNQLNFSFSEFVNVFQDIQNSSIRQDCLKICCTCYDLSNSLLRIIEMIIHYNASLILINNSITTTICVNNRCMTTPNDNLFTNENYESTKLKNYFGIASDATDENDFTTFDTSFENNLENNLAISNFGNFNANFEGAFHNANKSAKIDGSKDGLLFSKSQDTNEILLQQLCSVCNQILNRVIINSKCFKYVRQQLTNLDSMNEFNILSSVTAVLVELIVRNERTRYLTLNLLINDLNFQLSSYLYLIGQTKLDKYSLSKIGCNESRKDCTSSNMNQNSSIKKSTFDFMKYLNSDELKELKKMLFFIVSFNERNEKSIEVYQEEDLCTICYANKINSMFIPCLHKSCRSCITIHFLRNSECFFCKSAVEKVQLMNEANHVLYPLKNK